MATEPPERPPPVDLDAYDVPDDTDLSPGDPVVISARFGREAFHLLPEDVAADATSPDGVPDEDVTTICGQLEDRRVVTLRAAVRYGSVGNICRKCAGDDDAMGSGEQTRLTCPNCGDVVDAGSFRYHTCDPASDGAAGGGGTSTDTGTDDE